MISSDPVVSTPDSADSSSFLSSPDHTPLITKQQRDDAESTDSASASGEANEEISADTKMTVSSQDKGGEEEDVKRGSTGGDLEEPQLQLSVPDLINKESRAKTCDVWQKSPGPDQLASTPRSGKSACRISLGEEGPLGNGAPCSKGVSADEAEPHPDLLSFE